MRCSSPTVSQRKTAAMSRRKQSNPKPLKPGEDSEWTTNEESVGSSSDTAGKCEVKTELQPAQSPSPRPSTAEPEELPTTAADAPPKLRLNPNLATDPGRWSPVDVPSPQQQSPQPPPPPLPPPPPPATVITATAIAAAAAAAAAAASSSASSTSSSSSSSSLSAAEPPSHNVVTISAQRPIQIFICNPCGIRFSSLSTLDAHQTYYCSRRHKKDSESDDTKVQMVIETDEMTLGNDTDSRPSSVEPSNKSARTGKQYKCPHCSYSADKKVSLNRHMRMHSVSPVSVQSPPCAPDTAADPSVVDRYCQNCDIRFSNLGTYQAHKTHYCKTRHVVKPTPSGSPMANVVNFNNSVNMNVNSNNSVHSNHNNSNPSPTGLMLPTYLALHTNPVIVVPYSLVWNASVLPAMAADPSPPTDTACIVLADGTLQPIAQALVPANAMINNSDIMTQLHHHHQNHHQRDNSQTPPEEFYSPPPKKEENLSVKRPPQARPSSPLDLRLKRASRCLQQDDDGCGEEEKENRRSDGNVTDVEDIVCAPTIACMMSPSSSPPPPPLSSGNRTPHRSSQQQQQHHQPVVIMNGGVIQKSRTPEDGTERNGNFSVSSLLHIKQESGGGGDAQPVRGYHNNNNNSNNNNNVQVPTIAQYKPGGRHNVIPPMASAAQRNDPNMHPQHRHLVNPVTAASMLPYFTSDLSRRLAAAAVVAGAANPVDPGMPAAHHQFFLKQGPSKCESCNIVFCKYENFLAHKKHYCASRPTPSALQQNAATDADAMDSADKTSPEGSPGGSKPPTVASPQSSKDSASPGPAVLKPPMIQFICSTCGVKFSSFDNLTTHQSYYCPNRMTGGPDAVQADKPSHSRCPRCKMTVDSASLLHHQCPAANCWKCPVCSAVCTSASAAQKHLDNHNGIRAFVCTICQYKGNTLRGLKTHIRMHFNKHLIQDLMEEDYVSCVIDENSASSTSAMDREGLPKMIPIASQPVPPLQDAVQQVDRPAHVKATSAAASAVVVVSDDEDQKDLVVIKQEPVNGGSGPGAGPSSSSDGAEHVIETAGDGGGPVVYQRLLESPAAAASSSSSSAGGDQLPGSSSSGGGAKRGPATAKYCKACDISFNYLSTFIAHKKYYCRNSTEYKTTCNAENAKTTATVQT